MPWKCTYRAPSAERRPWTSEKLGKVAYTVCKSEGAFPVLGATIAAVAKCEGEDLFAAGCEALGAVERAAAVVQGYAEDLDTGIEIALDVLMRFGVIDPAKAAVVAGVVEVLSSDAVVTGLRDLQELLGCGGFTTGGGFGDETPSFDTGGGF